MKKRLLFAITAVFLLILLWLFFHPNPDATFTSPDGKYTLECYTKPTIPTVVGVLAIATPTTNQYPRLQISFAPITTVEPEKERQLISAHFEDENNKKIEQEEIGTQKVYLVLITKDTVGQPISINIDHENHEFRYNGKLLENGVLENLHITADTMRLELEATSTGSH